MGAFGELLQSYFGGTRHDVSTWGRSKKKKQTRVSKLRKKYDEVYEAFYKLPFKYQDKIFPEHPYNFMPGYDLWKKKYRDIEI